MKIIKEKLTVVKESSHDYTEEYQTYTHKELVDAVTNEIESDMTYADDESDLPTISDVLEMLHNNLSIDAAIQDHPQYEELIKIIRSKLKSMK